MTNDLRTLALVPPSRVATRCSCDGAVALAPDSLGADACGNGAEGRRGGEQIASDEARVTAQFPHFPPRCQKGR